MRKSELLEIRAYIESHTGKLSVTEMMHYYEMFMNGADGYLLGVEFNKGVYGIFTDTIPTEFCSCQTDHKANNQYLRFRPYKSGAEIIANNDKAICFGSTDRVYSLYTCNTKKGYNSGYCFEKVVYEYYNNTTWKQDNKPSVYGGDIFINGKEIQMKYVEKESLATITSTKKILRQIDKILKIME